MSYTEINVNINNYITNILNNEINILNKETDLLKQIYELLKKKINDTNILFEFNNSRFHLHFENEEKQIIYTMLINLIINKINNELLMEKKLSIIHYSAQSNIDNSNYYLCVELM